MSRWTGVLLGAVLAALVGCGGEPLPGNQTPKPGHELPPEDDGGGEASTSLYPLTVGSSWTYRITDDVEVFEKEIEVLERGPVPDGSGVTAARVHSTQPHLAEDSWMVERDGLVFRVFEEDFRDDMLLRTTTWTPAIMKSVATAREAGWAESFTSEETVAFPSGETQVEAQTYVWRVVGVESVTVPAGTFEAVKIERVRPDKPEKLRTYWLVEGVGKVKETGERLEELLKYEVRSDSR
ncbi:MAG TPA: hypothetical protein VK013_16485 [Myxococcaceae bacterium]|nr:hypothetical protein [Myxococcaceae bacterium]